jgi:hypothetical protein
MISKKGGESEGEMVSGEERGINNGDRLGSICLLCLINVDQAKTMAHY